MARKWWTLAAVVAGVFMLVLDITIVNVALPDIGRDFRSSLPDLQWVIDAYALVLAAGLLTAGSLADLWGRRRLYAAGVAVFTAGSLLCGLATGPLFLIIARVLQGLGGTVVFATSLALLGDAFRGRDRGTAFGIYGAVLGIAAGAGPVLGGVLTSGISWRWIFFINIPVGVATLAVTLIKVRESRGPAAARLDWAGFATFSGGLALLVYGLISSAGGWGLPKVYASLAAAGALLILFCIVEVRQRRPMLDMTLFRKPTFTGGLIAAFGLNASIYAVFTYLALYLQQQLGYSAAQTGARLLAYTGAMFVTSTVAGRLSHAFPVRLMIGAGFVLVAAGIWLMHGLTVSSAWTHLLPGLIIAGAGTGMVTVPLASTAVGVVAVSRAGMASGINSTFRQLGLAVGIAALGSVFTTRLRDTAAGQLLRTSLASQADRTAAAISASAGSGSPPAGLSAAAARLAGQAARAGFVTGLNDILLVGATVAAVAAVTSFALIRRRDFVPPPATADPALRQDASRGASLPSRRELPIDARRDGARKRS
jgi:EmrB/QacA subfamily drug resistance transporter